MSKSGLFTEIEEVLSSLNPDGISKKRKTVLQPFIEFLQHKIDADKKIRINFICTHNSRRSHLSQVWCQAIAEHFKISKVFCYSGGTQATALFPMAAKTLSQLGFRVKILSEGNNPVHSIKFAENAHPVIGFSKKLDDDFNPKSGFIAILTCSEADRGCPFVPGAEQRIPITYEDPKAFDNTPLQEAKYKERSIQIATELFYVFSQVKS